MCSGEGDDYVSHAPNEISMTTAVTESRPYELEADLEDKPKKKKKKKKK